MVEQLYQGLTPELIFVCIIMMSLVAFLAVICVKHGEHCNSNVPQRSNQTVIQVNHADPVSSILHVQLDSGSLSQPEPNLPQNYGSLNADIKVHPVSMHRRSKSDVQDIGESQTVNGYATCSSFSTIPVIDSTLSGANEAHQPVNITRSDPLSTMNFQARLLPCTPDSADRLFEGTKPRQHSADFAHTKAFSEDVCKRRRVLLRSADLPEFSSSTACNPSLRPPTPPSLGALANLHPRHNYAPDLANHTEIGGSSSVVGAPGSGIWYGQITVRESLSHLQQRQSGGQHVPRLHAYTDTPEPHGAHPVPGDDNVYEAMESDNPTPVTTSGLPLRYSRFDSQVQQSQLCMRTPQSDTSYGSSEVYAEIGTNSDGYSVADTSNRKLVFNSANDGDSHPLNDTESGSPYQGSTRVALANGVSRISDTYATVYEGSMRTSIRQGTSEEARILPNQSNFMATRPEQAFVDSNGAESDYEVVGDVHKHALKETGYENIWDSHGVHHDGALGRGMIHVASSPARLCAMPCTNQCIRETIPIHRCAFVGSSPALTVQQNPFRSLPQFVDSSIVSYAVIGDTSTFCGSIQQEDVGYANINDQNTSDIPAYLPISHDTTSVLHRSAEQEDFGYARINDGVSESGVSSGHDPGYQIRSNEPAVGDIGYQPVPVVERIEVSGCTGTNVRSSQPCREVSDEEAIEAGYSLVSDTNGSRLVDGYSDDPEYELADVEKEQGAHEEKKTSLPSSTSANTSPTYAVIRNTSQQARDAATVLSGLRKVPTKHLKHYTKSHIYHEIADHV